MQFPLLPPSFLLSTCQDVIGTFSFSLSSFCDSSILFSSPSEYEHDTVAMLMAVMSTVLLRAALLQSSSSSSSSPNPYSNLSKPHLPSLLNAKRLHASLLRRPPADPDHELFLYSKVLLLCTTPPLSSHGGLHYADLVFHHLQLRRRPSVFMWNTMIRAYSRRPTPGDAFLIFDRMRRSGSWPNSYTLTFLVNACNRLPESLDLGRKMHGLAVVLGLLVGDVFVGTALIDMYAGFGCVEVGRGLFERMECRRTETWNALIGGYVKSGDVDAARRLFDSMPNWDRQVRYWNEDEYGRKEILGLERKSIDDVPFRSLATWNTMISAYIQVSKPMEALKLFRDLQFAGESPNEITLVSVLPACAQLGALKVGEWLHGYAEQKGYFHNIAVCNALIDMYAKCGSIEKAKGVFQRMTERDLVSWNSMLAGLAIHGHGKEAIELFEEMGRKGLAADDITFVSLLTACSHAGLANEGAYYFERMENDYGIQPKIEHYGCIIDAFGRSHHLDKALNLVEQMPFKPNSVIFGSLLGACRLSDNMEIGEKVLMKLMYEDPCNSGYYVQLSNMYAKKGQFQEVIRIRNLMRSRTVTKVPGCSSIEVDNEVHEFTVGDRTHPMTKEIYSKLDEVFRELKVHGYVPDTSMSPLDLDEDEKERNLLLHSEKLAVVFGLLSLQPGKCIRVVKNLRVCVDCHSAVKLISLIYNREIVLRDRIRFHCFKDGQCSCNGFW